MHASVARNSHLSNKPEADLALISPPLSTSALHLRVFKATYSYTERKEVERRKAAVL